MLKDPQGAVFAIIDPENARPEVAGPPPLGTFSWHELATSDNEAAFAFYSGLFGWDAMQRMDMGPVGIYLIFGQNGVQRGGIYIKPADMPAPPNWLPYARVASADEGFAVARPRWRDADGGADGCSGWRPHRDHSSIRPARHLRDPFDAGGRAQPSRGEAEAEAQSQSAKAKAKAKAKAEGQSQGEGKAQGKRRPRRNLRQKEGREEGRERRRRRRASREESRRRRSRRAVRRKK